VLSLPPDPKSKIFISAKIIFYHQVAQYEVVRLYDKALLR